MRLKLKIILFTFLCLGLFLSSPSKAKEVLIVPLKGSITPISEKILKEGLEEANKKEVKLVLIILDTPGGLLTTTRKMVQLILNYPRPVAVYVYPQGAHAASAGIFLLAASDIAAMAPQTTLGSATPVFLKGNNPTLQKKIEEDVLTLLKTLCQKNKRNFTLYKKFITEAKSITAKEAILNKVIDYLATSPQDLLEQLATKKPFLKGNTLILSSKAKPLTYNPSLFLDFLSYILHPQIAYLLFLGGLLGLFFELSNPGTIFPGVVGSIALILGLYALSLLPINLTGILLILLALLFFILELKITSYGLLSVAGLISLFLGSYFFYEPGNTFFNWTITSFLASFIVLSLLFLLLVFVVGRSLLRKKQVPLPLELEGKVISWQDKEGQIKVRGEIWKATSSSPLAKGDKVKVIANKGLTLIVKPLNKEG